MNVREIAFDSAEYRQSLALREQVLRVPLGLVLSVADVAGESAQRHFGGFDDSEMIACVVAKPAAALARVKLRQMAVAERCRGGGVGRQLLGEVERVLRAEGTRRLELSARRVAEGFYRRLGYEPVGPSYTELGIEHIKMEKAL